MTIYRIAKWSEVFETAESRRHKTLNWVSMPVGFSSTGYQMLLDEFGDHAAAIYGAWCALVSVAATCPVRGLLCSSRGAPLKVSHIVRITGLASPVLEDLLRWASMPDVGWLEVIARDEALYLLGKSPDLPQEKQGQTEVIPTHPATAQATTGLPNPTQPNPTRPNPTSPYQTSPGPETGRRTADEDGVCFGTGEGPDFASLDREEVRQAGLKLQKLMPKADPQYAWETVWVSEFVRPGLIAETLSGHRSGHVKKPKAYIEAAIRKACEALGLSEAELRACVPQRPRRVEQHETSGA